MTRFVELFAFSGVFARYRCWFAWSPDEQRSGLPDLSGATEMSDPRPSAEYYRRIAAEIEELAAQSQLPEVRRELLDLAERFRRMAERRAQGLGDE